MSEAADKINAIFRAGISFTAAIPGCSQKPVAPYENGGLNRYDTRRGWVSGFPDNGKTLFKLPTVFRKR